MPELAGAESHRIDPALGADPDDRALIVGVDVQAAAMALQHVAAVVVRVVRKREDGGAVPTFGHHDVHRPSVVPMAALDHDGVARDGHCALRDRVGVCRNRALGLCLSDQSDTGKCQQQRSKLHVCVPLPE